MAAFYADGSDGTIGQLQPQSSVFAKSATYTFGAARTPADGDTIEFMDIPANCLLVHWVFQHNDIMDTGTANLDFQTIGGTVEELFVEALDVAGQVMPIAGTVPFPISTSNATIIGVFDECITTPLTLAAATCTLTCWFAQVHG